MRCYYAVLQVSPDATDDDLKKAYRKMALKCHPDKNQGREEEAHAEFKELSQAYTTLSDPHERAFYDRNKESILRGAEDESSASDELNVFKYFSNRCYPGGFTDADDGFYTVYRKFFHDLALKDLEAMKDEPVDIPSFGDSMSDLQDVANFYGYWTSYCTSISFAWADQIDIRQASCRYVEKKIEKENRKFRDKEKKQFNEEIRNLVLFARKRDPRWKRRVEELEERSRAAAVQREEHRLRQLEERQKQLAQDLENEALQLQNREYLEHLKQMERSMRGEDSSSSDEGDNDECDEALGDEEDEFIELSCLVCLKTFSHEKARDQHMKSKKHKLKVAELIREQNEDESNDVEDASSAGLGSNHEEESPVDNLVESGAESEEDTKPKTSLSKKERKQKRLEKKMQKKKKSQQQFEDSTRTEANDDLFTSRNLSDEIKNLNLEDAEMPPGRTEEDSQEAPKIEIDAERVDGRQKIKRNAKKVQEKAFADLPKKAGTIHRTPDSDTESDEFLCKVCSGRFPSKNKLFQHLKSSNHAAPKDLPSSRKTGKAKKK